MVDSGLGKDRRLYLFMMAHDASRNEAGEVFDARVDTVDLTPETAALS